ncbi:hypothetical protein QTH87_25235 [Variovorax sp. J22P168]|uniref:hypothetical protein n=1 Tax=Variovorax jilinensis TaxID=3053513 RepID=UPI002574985D|nr:hypothetical protein [Variovorax sp. J22P168]MDM0015768.1 hypothetical protein [Variovorax sp. J22P168]
MAAAESLQLGCRNGSSQSNNREILSGPPYREPTLVMRVPDSLVPRVNRMLATAKADAADAAWLENAAEKSSRQTIYV